MLNDNLISIFITSHYSIRMNYPELNKVQKYSLSLAAFVIIVAFFGLNIYIWPYDIWIPLASGILLIGFYKQFYKTIFQNSVAFAGVLLFIWVMIAMLYCHATWHLKIVALKHYLPLVFLPILMVFFQNSERYSILALHSFCLGCFFYMLLCIMSYFDILPIAHWLHRQPTDLYLYDRANYSFAITTFISLQFTFSKESSLKTRVFYCFGVFFLLWSLLFVSTVRTDYALVLVVFIVFAFQYLSQLSLRWAVIATVAGIIGLFSVYHLSEHLKQGVDRIAHGIVAYEHGDANTSSGLRLAFTQYSLVLIKQKPILGYGTGSFSSVYASHHFIGLDGIPTTPDQILDQPHNQFTYLMVEQGAIGTILFVVFLILAFKQSYRLSEKYKHLNQVIILLFVTNSFFMSTFFYHISAYPFGVLLALCLAQQYQKKPVLAP